MLLFISSYYREVLFRSINAIIDGDAFFYAKTMELPLFQDWTVSELVRFKYVLTIGFSVVFMLFSLVGLKTTFKARTPLYIAIAIYLILILLSIVIGIVGFSFINFETVYPYLRKIIGFIHSPLLFLFVSVSFIGVQSFSDSTKKNISNEQ